MLQNNEISPLGNLGEHQVKYTGDNSEVRPNIRPFIRTVRIYQAPIMCQVLLRHWRFFNGTELARGLPPLTVWHRGPINRKNSSVSLVIRELQMKTTVRVNFIPIRGAKIKTLDKAKCWQDCEATWALICAGGSGTWELTLEVSLFLSKLTVCITFASEIPLQCKHTERRPLLGSKGLCKIVPRSTHYS